MDALVTTQHHTLEPYDAKRLAALCGQLNEHLRHLSEVLDIDIVNRGNLFQLSGDAKAIKLGNSILQHLYELTASKQELSPKLVANTLQEYLSSRSPVSNRTSTKKISKSVLTSPPNHSNIHDQTFDATISTDFDQLKVKPRGKNQQVYIDNINQYDINFGIGPAGTGKTYLAVACAVAALEQGSVSRIILARPAVEAGEKLGFLPGDAAEKVDPYLKPLYDALHDMLGVEQVKRFIAKEIIEIAPLAYMRGRTLNNAFIILDESQNTTSKQMKMFLTRIGFGSKAVITGDPTQIDLPKGVESGIINAIQVLSGVSGIGFNYFDQSDIVRHALVKKIVVAYERFENNAVSPMRIDNTRIAPKNNAKAGLIL